MSHVIVCGFTIPVAVHANDVTSMTLVVGDVLVDYAYDARVGRVTACYSHELETELVNLIESVGIDTDRYSWDSAIDRLLNEALDTFSHLMA